MMCGVKHEWVGNNCPDEVYLKKMDELITVAQQAVASFDEVVSSDSFRDAAANHTSRRWLIESGNYTLSDYEIYQKMVEGFSTIKRMIKHYMTRPASFEPRVFKGNETKTKEESK